MRQNRKAAHWLIFTDYSEQCPLQWTPRRADYSERQCSSGDCHVFHESNSAAGSIPITV